MPTPHWRIRLVTDVYPPDCGGSGWSTHVLALALRDRGHDVAVISVDPSNTGIAKRVYEGIEVAEVGILSARRNPYLRLGAKDYSYGVLARYLTDRLVHEPGPGILHAQHLHSGPPAIAVGRANGWATILTLRDYWPVCLHGTSWWGGENCSGCDTANLTSCMQEYFGWSSVPARVMVGWARRRLGARTCGVFGADKAIAVSESLRRRVNQDLPGADLSVVPNMVDPGQVQALASQAPAGYPETPYLLAAGKLSPTKGFNLLLDSLAHVGCTIPLVVAGDGPVRGQLEKQAKTLGLPVQFVGWIPHDRLLRLQRDAHAVVLPSAWNEPLSRVILETMALGVPVVAWGQGGNPEMIETGVTGWLVNCPADLSAALVELGSDETRHRVCTAARDRVDQCYAPAVVYPMVAALYEAAVEEVGCQAH